MSDDANNDNNVNDNHDNIIQAVPSGGRAI